MTVCEISRNDALHRVEAVLKTGHDPGYEGTVQPPTSKTNDADEQITVSEDVDLAEIGRDRIKRSSRFISSGTT